MKTRRRFRAEVKDTTVLLLEQGSSDWSPWIHLPVTCYKTSQGDALTRYMIEPQRHQNGSSPHFVQARVLGGGSSVNAIVYMRGIPEDYDGWHEGGATGWSYKDVLPYFKKAESKNGFLAISMDRRAP